MLFFGPAARGGAALAGTANASAGACRAALMSAEPLGTELVALTGVTTLAGCTTGAAAAATVTAGAALGVERIVSATMATEASPKNSPAAPAATIGKREAGVVGRL